MWEKEKMLVTNVFKRLVKSVDHVVQSLSFYLHCVKMSLYGRKG